MSKMIAKELESQKSEESYKEEDKGKIRSYVMSLMKQDTQNPSDCEANASSSSETSNATRTTSSTPALKSIFGRARKQG